MKGHITILILLASLFTGCQYFGNDFGDNNPEGGPPVVAGIELDSLTLCQTIDSLVNADADSSIAGKAMREHYTLTHALNWIDYSGIKPQADTLLRYLDIVEQTGLKASLFPTPDIKADKRLIDSLEVNEQNVYAVAVRMDMLLTKAFMRYAGWQHYGLTNPYKLFNRLDRNKHDTVHVIFRELYDVPTEILGKNGYRHLAELAGSDSTVNVLADAEPKSELYKRLKAKLRTAEGTERERILVNMERCRWRHPHYPWEYKKYVVVNIPSYGLIAVDNDTVIDMKIVCGAYDTKTPLVSSEIMRMDLNPRWMMPPSVIKHEVARHGGDSAYFARHRYKITNRTTGESCNPAHVSMSDLQSGRYRVSQDGGAGNALGRIIFRFDNSFSIYLHDTSSKGVFSRSDRRASHGCVRVERPFDLAKYMLEDKDEKLIERIKYTMEYVEGQEYTVDEEGNKVKKKKLQTLNSVKVNPKVPLFITYYTMYLLPDNTLQTYPDVYGFDKVIAPAIKKYVTM